MHMTDEMYKATSDYVSLGGFPMRHSISAWKARRHEDSSSLNRQIVVQILNSSLHFLSSNSDWK
jgi:hypothetical protein